MAKITLTASPTFKANVPIPVPGGKTAAVEFIFKAQTKTAFKEFVDGLKDREDPEVILQITSGWDLEEPFSKENVEKMLEQYIGSSFAIIETYIKELTGARTKN